MSNIVGAVSKVQKLKYKPGLQKYRFYSTVLLQQLTGGGGFRSGSEKETIVTARLLYLHRNV